MTCLLLTRSQQSASSGRIPEPIAEDRARALLATETNYIWARSWRAQSPSSVPQSPISVVQSGGHSHRPRAHSCLQADSAYMCGLVEFAVGILVLGIAGQCGGRR
jgi:hypothetical protein